MKPSARPLGSNNSPSMSGVSPPTMVKDGWGQRMGMLSSWLTRSFLMASPDQIFRALERSLPLPPLTHLRQLRLGFRRNSFGDGPGIVPER